MYDRLLAVESSAFSEIPPFEQKRWMGVLEQSAELTQELCMGVMEGFIYGCQFLSAYGAALWAASFFLS